MHEGGKCILLPAGVGPDIPLAHGALTWPRLYITVGASCQDYVGGQPRLRRGASTIPQVHRERIHRTPVPRPSIGTRWARNRLRRGAPLPARARTRALRALTKSAVSSTCASCAEARPPSRSRLRRRRTEARPPSLHLPSNPCSPPYVGNSGIQYIYIFCSHLQCKLQPSTSSPLQATL